MANINDIAREAGVSVGTVSNVLNNSVTVREVLRKRVLDAVDAVGYQPSQLARGLRRVKTNMIGMIIPDITNPFFPAVVRGAEDVAFSRGYRLILCNTDNDHAKEIAHLNELRTYLPAGLIVIPSNFSDLTEQAESYRKAGSAIVCVDRLPKHWQGDSVTVDNEGGAYAATRCLLSLGHRRIATITGPLYLTNAGERLAGFRRAMRGEDVAVAPEYIQEASFERQAGYSKTLLLLRMIPRPTAIFASNDMIAFGALQAFREVGVRCPEDISLIGFDDMEPAALLNPELSSVSQPGYQLGTTAASILLDRVNGDLSPPRQVVLQTALQPRRSVMPVRKEDPVETVKGSRKKLTAK